MLLIQKKNVDIDHYSYVRYGIGSDALGISYCHGSGLDICTILFRVGDTSSVHADNIKRGILILAEGPTDRLDNTNKGKVS